jgi:hypothetical protein
MSSPLLSCYWTLCHLIAWSPSTSDEVWWHHVLRIYILSPGTVVQGFVLCHCDQSHLSHLIAWLSSTLSSDKVCWHHGESSISVSMIYLSSIISLLYSHLHLYLYHLTSSLSHICHPQSLFSSHLVSRLLLDKQVFQVKPLPLWLPCNNFTCHSPDLVSTEFSRSQILFILPLNDVAFVLNLSELVSTSQGLIMSFLQQNHLIVFLALWSPTNLPTGRTLVTQLFNGESSPTVLLLNFMPSLSSLHMICWASCFHVAWLCHDPGIWSHVWERWYRMLYHHKSSLFTLHLLFTLLFTLRMSIFSLSGGSIWVIIFSSPSHVPIGGWPSLLWWYYLCYHLHLHCFHLLFFAQLLDHMIIVRAIRFYHHSSRHWSSCSCLYNLCWISSSFLHFTTSVGGPTYQCQHSLWGK